MAFAKGGRPRNSPCSDEARRQRRKSRRLDQDPEMAFLPSRGLGCCERFEPQPPKRLKMRRFILGCRFTRADACVREAIEPLIKTSTFRLPVEAKIIPLTAPKNGQRSPFFHAFSGFRGVFLKVCPRSVPLFFHQKLSHSSVFPLPFRADFLQRPLQDTPYLAEVFV